VSGLASHYSYDAYGVTQTNASSALGTNTKLYCGEQFDSTLNMYNLRARYYDPSNGRFNQRDPFTGCNEDPQSLHKYTYAHCDPANRLDPRGEFSVVELLIVVAIVAVLAATLYSCTSNARKTLKKVGRAELEQEVELDFTLKPLREKVVDDTIVTAAQLKVFPEFVNRLAELREKIDGADKVIGLAAFFRQAQLLSQEQKERQFMAACRLQAEQPSLMADTVLSQACGGKSWDELSEDEVLAAGQFILHERI